MPCPKRKHTQMRRDMRRANWKMLAPGYVACSQCHSPRLPHHACPSCGSYAGRQATEVKQKTSKAKK